MLAAPAVSPAAVFLSITVAPPPLPVYVQPPCPVDGYLWNPGYWAYGDAGYYWVPGVWVAPPQAGLLWTPPWWGFVNGVYAFNAGYWGPQVGFYGGINYGFGYGGVGFFFGGEWCGRQFALQHCRHSSEYNRDSQHLQERGQPTTLISNTSASFNGRGGNQRRGQIGPGGHRRAAIACAGNFRAGCPRAGRRYRPWTIGVCKSRQARDHGGRASDGRVCTNEFQPRCEQSGGW